MILKGFLVLILMIGAVSALGVNLDCPDEVGIEAEFECGVEVLDGGGVVYDLKIEIEGGRKMPLEIFDEAEGWKSGWYYLKGFVSGKENVKLRILKAGDYDVAVKLREGDKSKSFDVGKISVGEGDVDSNVDNEESEKIETRYVKEEASGEDVSGDVKNDVIFLGDADEDVVEDKDWDYVSKDGVVVDWLPYAFCLFLIFLVGVLVWDRRR